ncbi:MAG: hypothetical protein IIA90_06925 [Chloroflexi bacterium]|nr:hypothetical protein [Chloroflexota bacterium]
MGLIRHQIADVIGKITRVSGPGGTGIDVAQQQAAEFPEGATTEALTAAISEAEAEVERQQQSAAYYYLYWQFENAYRLAYGTQLALLTALLNAGADGLEHPQVELFHKRHLEQAQKVKPEYQYPFASYIGFLSNYQLLTIDARYRITDSGRALLNWMSLQGLSWTLKAW